MAKTHTTTANLTAKIIANDKGNPPGKLADAELHFGDGVLAGLKLIGFAVWERRTGGGRNVTFSATASLLERRGEHSAKDGDCGSPVAVHRHRAGIPVAAVRPRT